MVGNGDVHRLRQLGSTYSLVDAEPTADAICAAIRDCRVDVCAQPLSVASAAIDHGPDVSAWTQMKGRLLRVR